MSSPEFSCTVTVKPLPEHTDSEQGRWAFSYTITISNSGDVAAQLIAREWDIVDTEGQVQQVRGLAVVGHQPFLQPGEQFQYSSWAQLATPQGSMKGRYLCVTEQAEIFWAEVPEFLLADSASLH
ncbi:Co2+/Mg2+ efflux protein ApaG [Pelomonas sp. SE-A7]|uniref:Co2+/Mg2+ efflux protein ApaG n=1 Tax=Pelomonas sp. SE-A7 TaxID=3054953 RepID=UPI00259CA242|nr:Co2+/Mg2+ efflux protein ApaG [Pelomonas sp. SE-A7]MDM4766867.1 Co2+/Mg2+ efflux protein ApaG [Pelomonas sp. SE-A7]